MRVSPRVPEMRFRTPGSGGRKPPVRRTSQVPSRSGTSVGFRLDGAANIASCEDGGDGLGAAAAARGGAVPADGGGARARAAGGRRLAVRAEVGWVPRRARERGGGARALVAEGAAAPSLLPRAAAAGGAPPAAVGPRRRDRDRARRGARLRDRKSTRL